MRVLIGWFKIFIFEEDRSAYVAVWGVVLVFMKAQRCVYVVQI